MGVVIVAKREDALCPEPDDLKVFEIIYVENTPEQPPHFPKQQEQHKARAESKSDLFSPDLPEPACLDGG
jgi:hypothetical protein